MPHFVLQMTQNGPMLNAIIGVSTARHQALTAASQPVPDVVPVQALIDTGASSTCIDPSVLKKLNLSPTGKASVITPSTGKKAVDVDQYDIALLIPGAKASQAPLVIQTLPAIACELFDSQGFYTLIGRDVLSQCLLIYDGPFSLFTLSF